MGEITVESLNGLWIFSTSSKAIVNRYKLTKLHEDGPIIYLEGIDLDEGTPVVFFHRPSRTVILADFSEAFSDDFLRRHWKPWQRWIARLWGITERPGKAPLEVRLSTLRRRRARERVRRILAWQPERKWCSVDHGAIPFLMNGADCMAAGIHTVCESVEEGDLIWIRDQEHGKPLAVGWALMAADEMVAATNGKAVNTIHWIGDELWELEL